MTPNLSVLDLVNYCGRAMKHFALACLSIVSESNSVSKLPKGVSYKFCDGNALRVYFEGKTDRVFYNSFTY